jgi:hypothetical protein
MAHSLTIAVTSFREPAIAEQSKRKILWGNWAVYYGRPA